jgi:hypothetical protein
MKTEGYGLGLAQIAILALQQAFDPHSGQRRNELVPVTILINWSAASACFLLQTIKQARQTVFNVVGPLGDDS